jgi:hypothetical protein
MEWLFRLAAEPRRLWRRYAQYPFFGLPVLAQWTGLRKYEQAPIAVRSDEGFPVMQKNTLVFSVALEGFDRAFADCLQTQRAYCHRFGFRYTLVDRAPERLSRDEAAWLKTPLIRAALSAGYEWVAFLDADCEIRPHAPAFPDHLRMLSEAKCVFMAPGFSGRINSGVVFVRSDPESIRFFDTILANVDTEVPDPADRVGWGENGHFIHYGKDDPAVYLLEHHSWNNNSRLDEQSYIQHYVRGPLREWYTARHPTPHAFSEPPAPDHPLKISESIRRLMPFLLEHYPEFRKT